jgi:GAF domain-containing protein
MIDEIELLTKLTALLHAEDERQRLLQLVVDQTALLLGVPRVSAWLFDETNARLVAGARAGLALHPNLDFEYGRGQGLIGWIAQNVETIRVPSAEDDPRFLPRPGRVEPLRSFLGVPLVATRRCVGVLSAVAPEPDYFSLHHERLMLIVAGICADRLELASR